MIRGRACCIWGRGRRAVQGTGKHGQVYGNWRGPSKIRTKTDATDQFTVLVLYGLKWM